MKEVHYKKNYGAIVERCFFKMASTECTLHRIPNHVTTMLCLIEALCVENIAQMYTCRSST